MQRVKDICDEVSFVEALPRKVCQALWGFQWHMSREDDYMIHLPRSEFFNADQEEKKE